MFQKKNKKPPQAQVYTPVNTEPPPPPTLPAPAEQTHPSTGEPVHADLNDVNKNHVKKYGGLIAD